MINGTSEASGLDFLKSLRFRWPVAAGVFVVMFAAIAAVVLALPNRYEARLKVVVKNDRVDPLLASDKQTQSILNVNDISEPRINTEIQLMTSSKVLLDAVKQCGLSHLVGMKGKPESVREEAAVRQLRRDLMVTPVRNSNVIEVSYESTDAHRSAEVVKAVWQAYALANRKIHGVPGSLTFFEQLSSKYDMQLSAAQAELSRFRREHDVVSVPEEQALALNNAAHLQSQIVDSAAEEQKSEAAATRLKQEMESLPGSVERDRRSIPNQALTQQLTSLLVTLKNKKTESSLRYQPGDRLLTELDAEIALTEKALAQAGRSPADEVSISANPAMDIARGEYIRMTALGAGAQAQTNELSRQMGKDHARLSALAAESSTYTQLVQKVTELQDVAQSYHRRTDEARFEQMLDEQHISNLALLDEPFTSALPSSPKRGLLLSLGFLWSVVIALISGAAVEAYTARTLRKSSTAPIVEKDVDIASQEVPEVTFASRPQAYAYRASPQVEGRDGQFRPNGVQSFADDRGSGAHGEVHQQGAKSASNAMEPARDSSFDAETGTTANIIRSPFELLQAMDLPLLANISSAGCQPSSSSFSILYSSVQRGDTSLLTEAQP